MPHIFGVSVVLAFLLPHTNLYLLMVNPLLCILLMCFRKNRLQCRYNYIVLIPLSLSILFGLSQNLELKSLQTAGTLLLYFFCFPFISNYRLPNIYIYITFLVIFISQFAYIIDVPIIANLLDTFYPISEARSNEFTYMQEHITIDNMYRYRLGGLYRNPNNCARSLTMLLAVYVILNNKKRILKLLPFIFLNYYAILLTGSRTGILIATAILLLFIFVSMKTNKIWKWSIVFFLLFLLIARDYTAVDLRGFNIEEGQGGINLKFDTFVYYLNSESSLYRLLLGYVDPTKFQSKVDLIAYFDSDYGNLIFCFGFIGFISILVYFFVLLSHLSRTGQIYFVLLFWMFSSTIIMSYRAVFIFMLLLSSIYQIEHKEEKSRYSIKVHSNGFVD